MKRYIFNALCFVVILIALESSVYAATSVTASGTAISSQPKAHNIAVQNAQRAAIEKGAGTLIDSSTLTENFELISDKVYSASQGYVNSYKVINEATVDGILHVTIRAIVDTKSIINDITALNIFQQQHFDNKRVLVLYKQEEKNNRSISSNGNLVESVRGQLQEELMDKNFRVFDDEAIQRLNQKIIKKEGALPDVRLVKDALHMGADILFVFDLTQGVKKGSPFSAALITLKTKVYDASTGQLLAHGKSTGRQLIKGNPGDDSWEDNLIKAGVKAAKLEGPRLISKIIKRNSQSAGAGNASSVYEINFKGFPQKEMDVIYKAIDTMGFKSYRLISMSPSLMRVEVFSNSGNTGAIQMQVRMYLKEKNIKTAVQQVNGNKMVFIQI